MYTKLRRDFGRHPNLADEPAEVRLDQLRFERRTLSGGSRLGQMSCACAHYLRLQPMQVLADIRPDSHISDSFIDRNPVVTTMAVVPDMSEHEVGLKAGFGC